jgi:hypothetical protein
MTAPLGELVVEYAGELQTEAQTAASTFRRSDEVAELVGEIKSEVETVVAGLQMVMSGLETIGQRVKTVGEKQEGIAGLAGLILGEVGETVDGVSRLLVSARNETALKGLDEAHLARAEFVVANGDASKAKERIEDAAAAAAVSQAKAGDTLRTSRTLQDLVGQLGGFVIGQRNALETGSNQASAAAADLTEYGRRI